MFKLQKTAGIQYYQIKEFKATGLVKHCFTTRIGGVSQAEYASLNLGLHVGDAQKKVIRNRKRICQVLDSELAELTVGEQVHGANIKLVQKEDRGAGARKMEAALSGIDALITDRSDILLSSYYADCTPVFLLDPVREVIALAHAGWKGTVTKIAQKTVLKMKKKYGTQVEDLLVGIGPAIGSCCYRVDARVVGPLKANFRQWSSLLTKVNESEWKLNLKLANQLQLEEIGVLAQNIVVSDLCTVCNPELFYSYRREGTTGRMASLIKLI